MKSKLFLSLILLFLIVNHCFSQTYRGKEAAIFIQNSELVRFKEYSKVPNYFRFSDNSATTVQETIEIIQSFIKNSNADLQLKIVQQQGNGSQTHRYYQTVNGFPIEFTALNLIVRNNIVAEMTGDILDNPDITPRFILSEESALLYALNFVNAQEYMWEENSEYFPTGEKVIVPDKIDLETSVLKSAYKFNIYSKYPFNRQMIYVDAESGEIILDLALIHFNAVSGTADTYYYGLQPIDINTSGAQYTLHDPSRGGGIRTYNCHNGLYGNATDFFNNSTHWDNTPFGTDAHFSTISAYDYFFQKHGFNSIDNSGFPLTSYVHFNLM
jgi:Zn-dependent metalloprotease